jgi:hypothetical protein
MFWSERKGFHGVMPHAGANTRGSSGVVGHTSSHRRRSEEMTRFAEVSELLCGSDLCQPLSATFLTDEFD